MNYGDINRILVISLIWSDRRVHAYNEMGKNEIDARFFDGIRHENGADGLKATFKSIFTKSINFADSHILIFEDDVSFLCNNVKEEIKRVISDIPEDYDLCKFGANLLFPVSKVTENVNRIKMSYALHAVLYSRQGMEKILKHIHEPEPIDVIIAKNIEPQGNCYVSSKMIATQRPGKSSIFKYNPQIHNSNSIKEIYDPETEVVNWHNLMVSQWDKNTKHIK